MATCREVVHEALRAIKAIDPGGYPDVDEVATAQVALQDLVRELHESRGAMTDIDVTDDYTAGENERVRVQNGYTVTITTPNSISLSGNVANDYGFRASTPTYGSTAVADGISYRQPRDGARIEITGTTQALYFYRADLNSWVSSGALALDDTFPLSANYRAHFAALLAERLIDTWPSLVEPTPSLRGRINRARLALYQRPGVQRDAARAEYF